MMMDGFCSKQELIKQFYDYIIMQELFDIITHKLGLINKKSSNLTNTEKDELLDELLIEKKKQALRILVETRLQQSLDSKRITSPEQLIHILERTHKAMIISDPGLSLPAKDDPIQSIVDLFVNFFTRQNCTLRAQEISNIHRKKLCPRGLMATTLFNWLVEWVRKHFQEYLKTTIHSLYVDSRQLKPRQSHPKAESGPQQLEIDQNCLVVKKHLAISVNRNILSSSYRQKRVMFSLQLEQKKVEKTDKHRMKSQSPSFPSQKSLKIGQTETIEVEQHFPINKEIFYSAYAQELQLIYKSIQSCVPDLDVTFAKRIRKGGRRTDIRRRIKEMASNLSKHMNHIKQNIDKYYSDYCRAHGLFKKRNKKQRKTSLDRLDKSDSPSKTSHGVRSTSTENIIDERRKNIISSLSKKHRYVEADQQQPNTQSNLLPNSNIQISRPKHNKQLPVRNKPIQLSFSSPRNNQQSKFLVLNSGYISAELQIIQQKAQKIKAKASKHCKKSVHKQKKSRSIDFNQEQRIDVGYSSLPVTIDVCPSSHIRLPKIRRLK